MYSNQLVYEWHKLECKTRVVHQLYKIEKKYIPHIDQIIMADNVTLYSYTDLTDWISAVYTSVLRISE